MTDRHTTDVLDLIKTRISDRYKVTLKEREIEVFNKGGEGEHPERYDILEIENERGERVFSSEAEKSFAKFSDDEIEQLINQFQ